MGWHGEFMGNWELGIGMGMRMRIVMGEDVFHVIFM
jgi:hypothetical protein